MIKPLEFIGTSRDDLRRFPDDARRVAGYQLRKVQSGVEPSDWKPLAVVGRGAKEIRIHVSGQWRVIYVAEFGNTVYVLHSFQKKSRKTRTRDIELARQRYKEIGGAA